MPPPCQRREIAQLHCTQASCTCCKEASTGLHEREAEGGKSESDTNSRGGKQIQHGLKLKVNKTKQKHHNPEQSEMEPGDTAFLSLSWKHYKHMHSSPIYFATCIYTKFWLLLALCPWSVCPLLISWPWLTFLYGSIKTLKHKAVFQSHNKLFSIMCGMTRFLLAVISVVHGYDGKLSMCVSFGFFL